MVSRTVKQETLSTMAFFYITGKQVGTKYVYRCVLSRVEIVYNMI